MTATEKDYPPPCHRQASCSEPRAHLKTRSEASPRPYRWARAERPLRSASAPMTPDYRGYRRWELAPVWKSARPQTQRRTERIEPPRAMQKSLTGCCEMHLVSLVRFSGCSVCHDGNESRP